VKRCIALFDHTNKRGESKFLKDCTLPLTGKNCIHMVITDLGVFDSVLPAGQGQAPARQAAIYAGLGEHVEATTVNKMCGSGMQAAIMAHDAIKAGSVNVAVAGGKSRAFVRSLLRTAQ